MSPRAAWRLETLGFDDVHDYVAGKADWSGNGLPIEGSLASVPRIGDIAERDVPTCGLGDHVGDVREQARSGGWDLCVVVNERRVVLGILRSRALKAASDSAVEDVMAPGPSTFRPNVTCHEMTHFMEDHDIRGALVTTGDGELMGFLRRADCELKAEPRPPDRAGGWPLVY
jgi:CBS domain-containing protein